VRFIVAHAGLLILLVIKLPVPDCTTTNVPIRWHSELHSAAGVAAAVTATAAAAAADVVYRTPAEHYR
jgi:hypothetical protein